jgi:catechol 2,3-dioxygenase-like lactoylglutathione lyase family enzyme
MIVGASHITLGCQDLDTGIDSLKQYGYRPDFIERCLPSDRSKNPLLSCAREMHGISLLRSEQGFPIELVSYGETAQDVWGRYIGVFESVGNTREVDGLRASFPAAIDLSMEQQGWAAGTLGLLDAPTIFVKGATAEAGLQQIVLPVTNIEKARRFWCEGLGFKWQRETAEMTTLHLAAPVSAWRISLSLVQSPPVLTRPGLDAKGMACLAFVSSNISEDVSRLIDTGADFVTDQFSVSVNSRKMRVAIAADPDGAFIELLQIEPS